MTDVEREKPAWAGGCAGARIAAAAFLLGAGLIACASSPARGEEGAVGSRVILDRCWSPAQLDGTEQDRSLLELGDATLYNREPPLRTVPLERAAPLPAALRGSIRSVDLPPGDQRIALTFDLCEMASDVTGYDAALVNYLRRQQVRATFYAGGKWMRSHPEKAKQLMADPLFELGNHAWTHGNLGYLSPAEAEQQILWTQAQYELLREELAASACVRQLSGEELEAIPRRLGTFRFPFGTCNGSVLAQLAETGLPAVQWDIVTGDPTRKTTAQQIAERIIANVRPGSIIIAHANGRGWQTAAALALVVPRLREQGYAFATVSELLAAGKPRTAARCFWSRPGDNDHVNARYGKGTEKPWPR
jgi:peptidoglycan-N-acetylglucosamine deacetylase